MNYLESHKKRSSTFWTIVGFALIAVVGILDFLTGYELAFSLFYLLPISLVAWHTSRLLGILASIASACVWLSADVAAGSSYSHPLIYVWNALTRLGFFAVTVFLLSGFRRALEREREIAQTDYLTGAINSRFFFDLVKMEIDRLKRYQHPFTLAYIDLDNFKMVNDRFGHSVGDQVLRAVVSSTRSHLRKTDVIARLGGDEFAVLLPETNQESARVALAKIQRHLLEDMQQGNWPITVSVGVVTCNIAPHTPDELVRIADRLMYAAKHSGKNAIQYAVYASEGPNETKAGSEAVRQT